MKSDYVFGGSYISSDQIEIVPKTLTIDCVTLEEVFGKNKPVCHFIETDKLLVLNKINWQMMETITGCEDSEDWSGAMITLEKQKAIFQGKEVDCVRIVKAEIETPF